MKKQWLFSYPLLSSISSHVLFGTLDSDKQSSSRVRTAYSPTSAIKKTKRTVSEKGAFGLSVAIAMILGSHAYAGKIISDAPEGDTLSSATSTTNKQFGFGGWNLDNVEIRVVDTDDFTGNVGSFNEADGTYTGMRADKSFEADITTGGEVRGHLHGKDWPVGEPSGIKIINADTKTKEGKPANCIMTSSYLEEGYLGAGNKPVLCSSGFQTHKRFKVNILPSTVTTADAEGYGLPVDLTFNLKADDTSTERYQVLQKVNNYSGKRLDGYKIEVLDATGQPNAELTLSLGIGEGIDHDGNPDGDIWDEESMANFSHGLWGPADHHFNEDGFFDSTRAYFTPALSADKLTASYTGPMQGGNYQTIFGNWLPSIWEPTGIFHDDDMNPETDGVLKAFWGDPEGSGTNKWRKGKADNWADVTTEELIDWTGEWYEQGPVEDVLNLGLNYIVNVGSNTAIGNTFTIRFTPHIAADQNAPSYVADNAPDTRYTESEGIIVMSITEDFSEETATLKTRMVSASKTEAATMGKDSIISVGIADNDLNVDPAVKETITVKVTSDHGETESVELTETDINTSLFKGTVAAKLSDNAILDDDGKFDLNKTTTLTATYVDSKYGTKVEPETLEAGLVLTIADEPTEEPTVTSSGGGSFNTLLMMVFGFLGLGGWLARRRATK
ncbi:MAG: Unknown protein [uncultured Thiotrichaceae bacterium]|uniref:Uncharacterized protein n=1 Tax=uncultured Thiotrichaceae bacterium TaxID=298394 RepID=A0A6S6TZ34_9GAMM|nr:MAG: Unknown protein [uncultured Thiotrichaceae bacterium]